MKKWFILLIFVFLIRIVHAQNGCCLNPETDTCSYVSQNDCCPAYTNVSDCLKKYFIPSNNSNACLELTGSYKDYCLLGCCCVNGESKPMYKGQCNEKNWMGKTCNSCTKTQKKGHGEECNTDSDCASDYLCLTYNLTKPAVKRCCNYYECANEEGCSFTGDRIKVNGNNYACINGNWRLFLNYKRPTVKELTCQHQEITQDDIECYSHGGYTTGGLFHGGLIHLIFGGWCKKDEIVSDYKAGFLKRCCLKKPEKFEWDKKWLTKVKDQASCGACWAFAATAVAEARYKITKNLPGKDLDLSEQMLLSCSDAGGCRGGWPNDAFRFIAGVGLVEEWCMPFSDWNFFLANKKSETSCSELCPIWKDDLYKFKEPLFINNLEKYENILCLQKYLKNYGPLAYTMSVKGSYYDENDVRRCSSKRKPGHVVAIVGWDDKLGAWIYKNSWGTNWGDHGYGLVKFGECSLNDEEGIRSAMMPNPSAVYCEKLGYKFKINDTKYGEEGLCVLPNNKSVDSWDFLRGKSGRNYSICAINGWEIRTKRDGKNSFSREYAVCLINNTEVPVTDLIGLTNSSWYNTNATGIIHKQKKNEHLNVHKYFNMFSISLIIILAIILITILIKKR